MFRCLLLQRAQKRKSLALRDAIDGRVKFVLQKTGIQSKFELVVMEPGQSVATTVRMALDTNPDLLVVLSASLAAEARRQHSGVPIVFKTVFDPVAMGLVNTSARPGNNMSGFCVACLQ
jgi:ABC-type uncharacterized transport system substrate-binding protein